MIELFTPLVAQNVFIQVEIDKLIFASELKREYFCATFFEIKKCFHIHFL